MKRYKFLVPALVVAPFIMTSAQADGYPFPTAMKVSIERGDTPIYANNSSVVYPIENYFSYTPAMNETETAFALTKNGGDKLSTVTDSGRFIIKEPISIDDDVMFAPAEDISPQPIRVMLEGPIAIGHIHFAAGSSALDDDARIVLAKIAEQMKTFGLNGAFLVGTTDRAGSESANLTLSQRRIAAATKYLKQAAAGLEIANLKLTSVNMGEYQSKTRDGVVNKYDRKVSVVLYPAS